ncbi:unnamed protein product [Caenorhabditis auriculariae]|uniref:Uncharacterized protein n=1 Tax=Caenorhabditis auriculariae TaxID=2777116 RepID=A0A8S1H355_9PELO|nr:unnamed protein product [Caenorhabditis auriculariae]
MFGGSALGTIGPQMRYVFGSLRGFDDVVQLTVTIMGNCVRASWVNVGLTCSSASERLPPPSAGVFEIKSKQKLSYAQLPSN